MAAYSATEDLLTGDIPLPNYVSSQKYVDDAADEIDSKIGFLYKTPVVFADPPTDDQRPARLLLKRINNFLATGRLLMAVDAGGEDTHLHAYAASLVNDATASLKAIIEGRIVLQGVDQIGTDTRVAGPLIANGDVESSVDAFYSRMTDPSYRSTVPCVQRIVPGRMA